MSAERREEIARNMKACFEASRQEREAANQPIDPDDIHLFDSLTTLHESGRTLSREEASDEIVRRITGSRNPLETIRLLQSDIKQRLEIDRLIRQAIVHGVFFDTFEFEIQRMLLSALSARPHERQRHAFNALRHTEHQFGMR